ncbi:hypothetical protein CK203_037054 [Vitis vinifera]|uniref:Uncharacterized protein n=1 Tax=Vitis vinifera TaxID=29760 RepID=A0A438I5V8_VITVI|nr:hypothetical protein CK203_037054 [Vitis vinifera]
MLQFDISLGLGMKYDFGWVYDSALLLPAQGPQLNCLDLYYNLSVLSDDKKRALYDQFGEAGVKERCWGQAGAYTTNPFDLFETFFGPSMGGFSGMDQAGFRTRRRTTVSKGEDIR